MKDLCFYAAPACFEWNASVRLGLVVALGGWGGRVTAVLWCELVVPLLVGALVGARHVLWGWCLSACLSVW